MGLGRGESKNKGTRKRTKIIMEKSNLEMIGEEKKEREKGIFGQVRIQQRPENQFIFSFPLGPRVIIRE